MDWKLIADLAREFKFAMDALLFWSAILLLPSDKKLFFILLILFILPQIAEYMEWHKLPF